MKRFTPKELANELRIKNKQAMRKMLRDYKELLNPQPSNHGFCRFQNGKDIDCGPYMTYDDDDLACLKRIYMFKQLGMKRSKIIHLMTEEEEEVVIDRLLAMLEMKEKEIKEQIIMAKKMKDIGTESVLGQFLFEGRSAHEFVEYLRDSMRDYDSGMINMCLFGLNCEWDQMKKELSQIDCLEYPSVNDFFTGNALSLRIQEMGRFDDKIYRNARRLLRLLQYSDVMKRMDQVDKYVKSLVKVVSEGYGFIGKVSFGLVWQTNCLAYDEENCVQIELALSDCLPELDQDEINSDIRIMFAQAEWQDDLFYWFFDSVVNKEDNLADAQKLLSHLCEYAIDKLSLNTEAEKIYFIHLLKQIWKRKLEDFASDSEYEDDRYELQALNEWFANTIIPELQKQLQII